MFSAGDYVVVLKTGEEARIIAIKDGYIYLLSNKQRCLADELVQTADKMIKTSDMVAMIARLDFKHATDLLNYALEEQSFKADSVEFKNLVSDYNMAKSIHEKVKK